MKERLFSQPKSLSCNNFKIAFTDFSEKKVKRKKLKYRLPVQIWSASSVYSQQSSIANNGRFILYRNRLKPSSFSKKYKILKPFLNDEIDWRASHKTAIWVKEKFNDQLKSVRISERRIGVQLSFSFGNRLDSLLNDCSKAYTDYFLAETFRLAQQKISIELLYQAWIELFHYRSHIIYRYDVIMKSPFSLLIHSMKAESCSGMKNLSGNDSITQHLDLYLET